MNNDNKIDQEELDRIEDELLEKEAGRREEEKMRTDGRSVFEIERMKREKSHNNQDSKKPHSVPTDSGTSRGKQDTDKIQ